MNKILVFIPTYNEKGNIARLYTEIKKISQDFDILFCDDNSPDGTGQLIDTLSHHDNSVKVIHRPGKMGLGTAYVEGFKYARTHCYSHLVTMDADFTHDPVYIPALMAKKDTADIVIGSRYLDGAKMEGWNKIRLPFTYFWRGMIKYGLGMPYDCTGAFRVYNVKILNPLVYQSLTSQGFSIGLESLYRFIQHGAVVGEVPIIARSRQEGKSKLNSTIMREFARQYFRLVIDRLFYSSKKPMKNLNENK